MTQPIQMEVIVGSIVFIFGLVGVGLAVVAYYKKKLKMIMVKEPEVNVSLELFLKVLDGYLKGNEDIDTVRDIFNKLEKKYRFSHFHHYLDDEDIRLKDDVYKDMQNQELKKYIFALKNEDLISAENISFLGYS